MITGELKNQDRAFSPGPRGDSESEAGELGLPQGVLALSIHSTLPGFFGKHTVLGLDLRGSDKKTSGNLNS